VIFSFVLKNSAAFRTPLRRKKAYTFFSHEWNECNEWARPFVAFVPFVASLSESAVCSRIGSRGEPR